jgi:hypothetical protein
MKSNVCIAPAYFGQARIASLGPSDRTNLNSPITFTWSFVNNLKTPVSIEDRSGFKFQLDPEHSMFNNELIIRLDIRIRNTVKLNTQRLLSAVDDFSSPCLTVYREALREQVLVNRHNGATITVDYAIKLEDIKKAGGSIFYHEIDKLISIENFDHTPPHPHSERGRKENVIALVNDSYFSMGFGYSVRIVDNNKTFGLRYLNISGTIFKIEPVMDLEKESGVYLYNRFYNEELGEYETTTMRYDLETGSEKLKLFKSHSEAVDYLDNASNDSVLKIELAKLEHELNVKKNELQITKHSSDILLLKKESEFKLIELERNNYVREANIAQTAIVAENETKVLEDRQRIKDHYEDKSHVRKDTSETLKFIPSVIVGVGAFLLALKALF